MMGANEAEMGSAPFGSTFRHSIEPGGLVLLRYALWHGLEIFRIYPTIKVVLRS